MVDTKLQVNTELSEIPVADGQSRYFSPQANFFDYVKTRYDKYRRQEASRKTITYKALKSKGKKPKKPYEVPKNPYGMEIELDDPKWFPEKDEVTLIAQTRARKCHLDVHDYEAAIGLKNKFEF